jgi:Fuc2NAc and GlcNAc transferase
MAIIFPGLCVALVGLLDDFRNLEPSSRLLVHGASALAGVILSVRAIGVPEELPLIFGILLVGVAVVGIVWFVNLFNFMDGIDGLAAGEAVFLGAGVAVLCWNSTAAEAGLLGALVAAASGGFLWLNWPPARLFMGDVGSGFLGAVLAVILVQAAMTGLSAGAALILPAAFVVDATVTLVTRWWRAQPLTMPHRTHLYQKIAARTGSHRIATTGYMSVNLCWLLPLAYAAQQVPEFAPYLAVLAYLPLVSICANWGAGR